MNTKSMLSLEPVKAWNHRDEVNALVTKIIDQFVRDFKAYVDLRLTNCKDR